MNSTNLNSRHGSSAEGSENSKIYSSNTENQNSIPYAVGTMQQKLHNTENLGPSTLSIIAEAEKRGIPWRRLNDSSKILLGHGKNQQIIRATMTGKSSCIAVETVDNKYQTKNILDDAGIPVPRGSICTSIEDLEEICEELGFPLVIKPAGANHGRGVSVNIQDLFSARQAFDEAKDFRSAVMVEKHIEGKDFRLLVIGGKLVAAAHRQPAQVKGDGRSTIKELIEKVNADPRRGEGHLKVLTKISLDADTEKLLNQKSYTLEGVPAENETVVLKSTANLSTGGTATDVTDKVHPENRFLAERAAAILDLDICGIDIISPDIGVPLAENRGAVIEVNAAPGFRMHLAPSEGQPRNVAAAVIDMLFPAEKPITIPIFAITGTNGKTTVTRLLAHLAQSCGYSPGFTTTDGISVAGHEIVKGDCSGPSSAALVLADPLVDFAILETARGGLLRAGLAFEKCDVGILTNIAADHLGLKNINTLEELAEVKAAVVRSVKSSGWAVLNAEDHRCVTIAETLNCNVAFFSLDPAAETARAHVAKGGLIATVKEGNLVVYKDHEKTMISGIMDIPLTLNGTSRCMTANILAATAAAFAYGFTQEQIKTAWQSFKPGLEQTPGRMNYFKIRDFSVLVDYAHNPHGMCEMQDYLSHIHAPRKVGIVAGVGDRRDSDIIELAEIAANMFDRIIVRQEHSLRGRELDEMNNLMIQGMEKSGRKVPYEMIPDEKEAIRYALETAQTGDYIVALSDNYQEVIKIIKEFAPEIA
ncbi:cyanophycin synthetase [Kaistella daneshvariae]|uniref:Cyanophycin synthetase n=1 Tax=Kaistella daneshvariae TaxID=2487074 RepID=A0ABN5SZM2_9FLAO|nr:cyanophycin synthetase [Kaistella daneshvariae]AZI67812.1 cyanophycin synthetase [Kaistella daneshvariae]